MAVKIKLQRLGKIRDPHYRIIVADARTRRSGRAIETIGTYYPRQQPSHIDVKSERVQYWLGVGAQPTEPVQQILQITGDWQKFNGLPGAEGRLKRPEPKPDKAELFAKALAQAGEEPTTEATTPKKRGGGGGRKSGSGSDKTEGSAQGSSSGAAEDSGESGAKAEGEQE